MITRSKLRAVPLTNPSNREAHYYPRIVASLKHPSCPSLMTDDEAETLARHIAVRVFRFGPKIAGKMPRTAK